MLAITIFTIVLSGPALAPQTQQVAPTAQAPQEHVQNPQDPNADNSAQKVPQDQKAETKEPPTPPHTGIRALFHNLVEDYQHLPSKQNLYLAAIGGGLALAAHPGDQSFNARLNSHYTAVNRAFTPAKYFADTPEQVALSLGTYAFGR